MSPIMVFTLLDVYRGGVPRGQYYRSPVVKLENGSTSPLTVSPTTSPENWALLIHELKYITGSPVTSGTGTGLLQIEYPDYVGENQNTYAFPDLDSLDNYPDEVVKTTSTDLHKVIKFKPPILLKGSNTEKDLTIGLPDFVDIDSGDISFLVTGWTIKESDYE